MSEFTRLALELVEAGRQLHSRGLVPATSGNLSARMSDGTVAITVSGKHKGQLQEQDIMLVDKHGCSLDDRKPSAETLLHTSLYARYPDASAVLHPHSVNSTLISRLCEDWLNLGDYEILKAFPDIHTHQCQISVPIFTNDQDVARLSTKVDTCLSGMDIAVGYLIRGHGFYTWGSSVADAMRHLEALEFMFECELRLREIAK
ncbi:MAG: methylthioribulose 1-phosphate dehydratase [Gammaproteobacteria bacterium]|nr:methylthioribulose 1-phosphate dehydratase [Gammaproteobacteria bacterium]